LDLLTLGLMLLAGLLHASWHGLVKGGADQTISLAGMGLVAGLVVLPSLPFVPVPPLLMWPILGVSVILHGGYKICLAQAYRAGDLGQAFPMARGAVPLFSLLLALVALKQVPTLGQLTGVALTSVGQLVLAIESLKRSPDVRLLSAAFGAGLAVASYSVLDAYGTRLYGDWAGFTAWLIVLDNFAFLTFSRVAKRGDLWRGLLHMRMRVLISGCLGLASFSIFLWALSRNPVGPVSAVRETSILFAMLIGAALHRERVTARRIIGGLIVVAGVMTIAIAR
jgi:drug/metabolite transporter (DMT)-like permease